VKTFWNLRASIFYLTLILAIHACLPVLAGAKSARTGNQYVTAQVDEGSGNLTIFQGPPSGPNLRLSYDGKSFLTVKIGDRYFTNNPFSQRKDGILSGAILNIISDRTGKKNDTIICTWPKVNNVDIVQISYPVTFSRSGQIVTKFKAINHNEVAITVQPQFLLDVNVDNDKAKILTRYGYKPNWAQFYQGNPLADVPPYFLSFKYDLPGTPPGNFGPIIAQGYTNFPTLGLMQPTRFTIGDWSILVDSLWGPTNPLPNGEYGDNAELFEWGGSGVLPNGSAEIGSFSYGTGEPEICGGRLLGLTFYPHNLSWNKLTNNYDPNPFEVETFIFNTDKIETASSIKIKLTVDPGLKIIDPPDATANGLQEEQIPPPGASNPFEAPLLARWKVVATPRTDCTQDTTLNMYLSGKSSFDPVTFAAECPMPLMLECPNIDKDPPIVSGIDSSKKFIYSFDVHDDRTGDFGLQTIDQQFTGKQPSDVSAFTVDISPQFDPNSCSKKVHKITITQKDSTIGGCFDYTFTDCAGNKTLWNICFPAHPVINNPIPDTIAPRILFISGLGQISSKSCGYKCDTVFVKDDSTYDKGLKSIDAVSASNMGLTIQPFAEGTLRRGFIVCVNDTLLSGSITIEAQDVAGNKSTATYDYCPVKDTLPPVITISPINNGVWHVNVADKRAWDRGIRTITLSGTSNVTVTPNPNTVTPAAATFDFDVSVVDKFKPATFCVEAMDTVGNASLKLCRDNQSEPDTLAPNIIVTKVGEYCIDVKINDLHPGYSWDRGIDSIWFIDGKGMNVPANIHRMFSLNDTTFRICVEDTLDTTCVTIRTIDGGNNMSTYAWCWPSTPDEKPPIILGLSATHITLDFEVSDSLQFDRGLKTVALSNAVNFDPYNITQAGARKIPVTLNVTKPGASATGKLTAIDQWGANATSIPIQSDHTASVDVAIYAQHLSMQKSLLAKSAETVSIPVNLIDEAGFQLKDKNIWKYSFSMDIIGDYGVNFVGVDTKNTLSENWTVTPNVTGNRITITGSAPSATSVLTANDKPLVYLQFFTPAIEYTKQAILTPVVANGVSVTYNDGADVVVKGQNATAVLPAPFGNMSGTHIVIQGSCSPLMESSTAPSIIAFEPPHPNPFSQSTTLTYGVPEDAIVHLSVFDALGNEIQKVTSEAHKAGWYKVNLPAQNFAQGTYYARLQINDKVITRSLKVTK